MTALFIAVPAYNNHYEVNKLVMNLEADDLLGGFEDVIMVRELPANPDISDYFNAIGRSGYMADPKTPFHKVIAIWDGKDEAVKYIMDTMKQDGVEVYVSMAQGE